VSRLLAWGLTFLAVVVAWVFFRAPTFSSALAMLHAMAGGNGIIIPSGFEFLLGPLHGPLAALGISFGATSGTLLVWDYVWVAGTMAIALFMPNTMQLLSKWQAALDAPKQDSSGVGLRWVPSPGWAFATAAIGLIGVLSISRGGEFLYWQF
jgi:hypothetical protein